MVDVGLPCDLLVALLDLLGRVLVLPAQLLVRVAGLGQLDLDIPQRVLQLLVLNLCQAKHLTAFLLSSLVTFYSQAFAMG